LHKKPDKKDKKVNIALGIDTGGTYTDAVLIDNDGGEVLGSAKSLTTKQDLALGIKEAIQGVIKGSKESDSGKSINLVALSTTLATNAIAEGHGAPVSLLLIGYDKELVRQYNFQKDLATPDVVYLKGGHNIQGNELHPLDESGARQAIKARCDAVSAFAVSGYFGAFNPSHELRVQQLVRSLTDLPVTCGHQLSTRLDSIRRATTVALNARLISLVQDLIAKVRAALTELSIAAPLMVVKGDGSLVRADWAMQRPVETVLSGPAASALGANRLAGNKDGWVADVGGTTTDIIALKQGRPDINPEGANIGGWQTMVEAVDAHTVGLGGDSHIHFNEEGQLIIGPDRVVPLCILTGDHPQVLEKLHLRRSRRSVNEGADQFLLIGREPRYRLSAKEKAVLTLLKKGPRSLAALVNTEFSRDPWIRRRIAELEQRGLIQRAGFTPTDALHVLNRFERWNPEGSRKGAKLLAAQMGVPVPDFCRTVIRTMSEQLAATVVNKVITDEFGPPQWAKEPTAKMLMDAALGASQNEQLSWEVTLHRPLVALGAPVEAYMPHTAELLHTELVIPPNTGVANAIGAVSGGVLQQQRIYIRPLEGGGSLRVHLPEGHHDFAALEPAVEYARERMIPRIEAQAHQAGADQVEVRMRRVDKRVRVPGAKKLYLGTELFFTASGRPSSAREQLSED